MSIHINVTNCTRPKFVVFNRDMTESDSESESESESDGSFVSDTETEASVSEDEGSESEPESDSGEDLREVKPYHGQGFHVYFDSIKDRRHFMRAFGFN